MFIVAAALLPGIAAMTYYQGLGVLWNIALLLIFCAAIEMAITAVKGQPSTNLIVDGSAVVTAILIAVCIPPFVSPGPLFVGAAVAIGLAKHTYGGLGRNIFNPAMAGYAAMLVSFPVALSTWPSLTGPDGLSGATLLTEFRYREGLTSSEFRQAFEAAIDQHSLITLAFAFGGVALVWQRLVQWRIPAALFIGTALGALFGWDQGSSESHGSVWFHITTGGTVIAAFFVASDPVTHPENRAQQWLFGILVGLLIYVIRAYGAYPDGIAFAILLANCTTPLLDRYARTSRDKAAKLSKTDKTAKNG
ncbi:MAG: electron transport complex protein RnfD [Limisphaerales bacterium]|jgi:electron transport complex protein RnfD